MFHRLLLVASALIVISTAPSVASAISPERSLSNKQTQLAKLLKQKGTDREVAAALDSLLDSDAIAKGSLGGFWRTRTPKQRREFQTLFRTLLRDGYRRNFLQFPTVKVHKGVVIPDGVRVRTTAKRGSRTVSIHYVMHEKQGKWRVRDVFVGSASLVGNYRAAFAAFLEKYSFDRLLLRMRTKATKLARASS
jgi:phospholipid transport system substrate-binding protein